MDTVELNVEAFSLLVSLNCSPSSWYLVDSIELFRSTAHQAVIGETAQLFRSTAHLVGDSLTPQNSFAQLLTLASVTGEP